jgi:hypothetical protein
MAIKHDIKIAAKSLSSPSTNAQPTAQLNSVNPIFKLILLTFLIGYQRGNQRFIKKKKFFPRSCQRDQIRFKSNPYK